MFSSSQSNREKIDLRQHRISSSGLVERPIVFSLGCVLHQAVVVATTVGINHSVNAAARDVTSESSQ